jgi:hypothetical protein
LSINWQHSAGVSRKEKKKKNGEFRKEKGGKEKKGG